MSGRMTSLAASKEPLPGIAGVVFFAFPLHPGPPEAKRAEHLAGVSLPLLFVSGTRDKMADRALLEKVAAQLARATLHFVEGADHSLHVPKTKRSSEAVMDEIAAVAPTVAAEEVAHCRQRVLVGGDAPRTDAAHELLHNGRRGKGADGDADHRVEACAEQRGDHGGQGHRDHRPGELVDERVTRGAPPAEQGA